MTDGWRRTDKQNAFHFLGNALKKQRACKLSDFNKVRPTISQQFLLIIVVVSIQCISSAISFEVYFNLLFGR